MGRRGLRLKENQANGKTIIEYRGQKIVTRKKGGHSILLSSAVIIIAIIIKTWNMDLIKLVM